MLVALRYAILNFPRIAYETMRWTLRMALIDLPRIVGKDLSGSLPSFLMQWLGSSKSEVRVVEKIVNVGTPPLTMKQRLRRRIRYFVVDTIIVSIAWNWSVVYPWIAPLWQ